MALRRAIGTAFLLAMVAGCGAARHSAASRSPETREACEARKQKLVEVVAALPEASVATASRADLPVASIGRAPGSGPVVDVSPSELVLPERPALGGELPVRARAFGAWLSGWLGNVGSPKSDAAHPSLYLSVAGGVDVRTLRAFVTQIPASVDVRLLVRTVQAKKSRTADPGNAGEDVAERLLRESSATERRRIADEGYASLAQCEALSAAMPHSVSSGGSPWPERRAALLSVLPRCDCAGLDTGGLALLASAEQHAGVSALGYLPFSFLRDERCDASMPLRSVEKLVKQMEQFDAEFSAKFAYDAVTFDDVLTNERLRVTFCDALPGETLAEKARIRARLYVRLPGTHACEAWALSPLAPGSPMGTISRVAEGGRAPLAFHFWQAAEEIRLFGPAEPGQKSTEARDYPCEETFHLTGIDENALHLGTVSWFFSEAACQTASNPSPGFSGCVLSRASGAPVDAR